MVKHYFSIIFLCLSLSPFGHAEVRLPHGEYHLNVTDFQVKVLGGYVSVQHNWYENKWHHNHFWNNLQLEYDSVNGSVISIDRNGDVYRKLGRSTGSSEASDNVFTSGKRQHIEQSDTGFRWQNIEGDWVEYDPTGRISRYGNRNNVKVGFLYNTKGQRIGVTDHHDTQILWYTYAADGTLTYVRDNVDVAQGRSVRYTYSNNHIATVTDVRGNRVDYTYLDNRLAKITDQEGHVTSITYDSNGRVATVKAPGNSVTHYKYSFDKKKHEHYIEVQAPSGKVTESWYSKAGDTVRRAINGSVVETIVKKPHDSISTDGLGNKTLRGYDVKRNLTSIIYADNTFKTYEYDNYGNVLIEVNKNGVRTKNEYNANGMITRKIEAYQLDEQRITTYTYDEFGQLTKRSRLGDAVTKRADTTYTYDDYGNKKTKTDPEGNVTTYIRYDSAGNLLKWRVGKNKKWKASYDKAGNLLSRTDPAGQSVLYTYNKINQVLTLGDYAGDVTRLGYDNGGRLAQITDALNTVMTDHYNSAGQLVTHTDGDNQETHFGYDERGRLNSISDSDGNVTKREYLDGVTENLVSAIDYPTYRQTYIYDKHLRQITSKEKVGDSDVKIMRTGYDGVGNIILRIDVKGQRTVLAYDNLNRLVSQTNSNGNVIGYKYDNRDNLLSVTKENGVLLHRYTYDRNNRVMTEIRL